MSSKEEQDPRGRRSRAEIGRRGSAEKSEKRPEKTGKRSKNSEVISKTDKKDTKKSANTKPSSGKHIKEPKMDKPADRNNNADANKNNNYCDIDKMMKEREKRKAGAKIQPKGASNSVQLNNSRKDVENVSGTNRGKITTEKKTKKRWLPKRAKAVVPCSWRSSDLDKRTKELETKIQHQKEYIRGQEETSSSIFEITQTVAGMKEDESEVFERYLKMTEVLGDETGEYEQEIRYYKSEIKTSDDTNKMAGDIYTEHAKHRKSLKKTMSIIQDKTDRLHDHQDVAEVKEAIKSLHEARDKEEYLVEKLSWYQDKIKECRKKKKNNEEENAESADDEDDDLHAPAKDVVKLPSIDKTISTTALSRAKTNERPPLPPGAKKDEETLQRTKTRRGRLPTINGQPSTNENILKHRSDPCLDLEFLLESRKEHKETYPKTKGIVPSCVPPLDLSFLDEMEDDDDSPPARLLRNIKQKAQKVPKPPQTPKKPGLIRRIRALIGWK